MNELMKEKKGRNMKKERENGEKQSMTEGGGQGTPAGAGETVQ